MSSVNIKQTKKMLKPKFGQSTHLSTVNTVDENNGDGGSTATIIDNMD